MPTPNGVNSYFSSRNILDNFADFQEQESKSGCSSYMLMLSHRNCFRSTDFKQAWSVFA